MSVPGLRLCDTISSYCSCHHYQCRIDVEVGQVPGGFGVTAFTLVHSLLPAKNCCVTIDMGSLCVTFLSLPPSSLSLRQTKKRCMGWGSHRASKVALRKSVHCLPIVPADSHVRSYIGESFGQRPPDHGWTSALGLVTMRSTHNQNI